jgi:hypothetical protein
MQRRPRYRLLSHVSTGQPVWRKSSFSYANGDCVLICHRPDGTWSVRDSKDPTGPILAFGATEWEAFVAAVKAGEFDIIV